MLKAYDLSDLVNRLKGDGIALAEQEAKLAVAHVCDWAAASAALSDNKIDDLAALGLPQLEKLVLGLIPDPQAPVVA